MAIHTIELFAGVGMLGEGLRAGLGCLGEQARAVCYVEREAYAAAVLAARIQEGSLDAAPVWSDVCTFNAHQWAGAVDCIVAGFPCQDLSLAGQRAGLDGARSGLFFEVLRIARDCGAEWLFLENVSGIATATATAVDEAEGALEERAAARVVGELADLGWDSEWITISASDVGASHGRSRWFCLAWKTGVDNATGPRRDGARQRPAADGSSGECLSGARCTDVDNLDSTGAQRTRRAESGAGAGREAVADPQGRGGRIRQRAERARGAEAEGAGHALGHAGLQRQLVQQRGARPEHPGTGGVMENRHDVGARRGGRGAEEIRRGEPAQSDCSLANAGQPGLSLTQQPDAKRPWRRSKGGATAELCGAPLFAPGPADPAWSEIIRRRPHLAPALESGFRGVADGVAHRMDDSRAQRLKCCGNGVVAAQAAAAFVELYRRLTWHSTGL